MKNADIKVLTSISYWRFANVPVNIYILMTCYLTYQTLKLLYIYEFISFYLPWGWWFFIYFHSMVEMLTGEYWTQARNIHQISLQYGDFDLIFFWKFKIPIHWHPPLPPPTGEDTIDKHIIARYYLSYVNYSSYPAKISWIYIHTQIHILEFYV